MKIEPKKPVTRRFHGIEWMFLLVITLCFQYDVKAQTQLAVAQPNYSFEEYVAQHKNSALVKYYLFNPNDREVANAIRYASILESPMKKKISPIDVERMTTEVNKTSIIASKIEELAKQNGSYERAAAVFQNKKNLEKSNLASDAKNQKSDANGNPVLILPAAK